MFESRNRTDLIIEVWEKLDCESVGSKEIVAIENAVRERFGPAALDSPMVIARLLADEGAELRHSEIMELYLQRASEKPRNIVIEELFDLSDLDTLHSSLINAERMRRSLLSQNDNSRLRSLRNKAIEMKKTAASKSVDMRRSEDVRRVQAEAASWITLWLQSPELFENWVKLRQSSEEFKRTFTEN